jgi:hypothetical protein
MTKTDNMFGAKEDICRMGRQGQWEKGLPDDGERRYNRELADVAADLYRLLQQLRKEFPFLTLSSQDQEDLLRAACILLELDLIDEDPPAPEV